MTDFLSYCMVKKRNYELDFWKFVSAIFVILFHSHTIFDGEKTVLLNGYLTVGLFYIITGFLFASSVYRDTRPFDVNTIGKETWQFICKKTKGFLYYYIFGFAGTFIADCFATNGDKINLQRFPGYFADFLLLRETGMPFEGVMGANWYLSSMLIALFILYPVFRYKKQIFSHIASPIIAVVLFGYMFMRTESLAIPPAESAGLFTSHTLQAISQICMGVTAFAISEELRNRKCSKLEKTLLSLVDIFCIVSAFILIIYGKKVSMQPCIVFLFFVFVCVSGSQQAYVTDIFKKRPCAFLGKLSLSVYLSHSIVRSSVKALKLKFPELGNVFSNDTQRQIIISLAIYLAACFAVAVICIVICEAVTKLIDNIKQNKKGL